MTASPDAPAHDAAAVIRGTEVELFSVAGMDGHLREVNEAFARLLGLTAAEVSGRSLLELVHPADLAHVVAGLGALEGGAAEVLLENRFTQRDGHWVHLQWVARPVPGTDLWWAAGRDTTEFHRLLADRVDLRAQLDLALGQVSAAMWELDIPRRTLTWEPAAAQLLGTTAENLPTTPAAFAAAVHPEDSEAVLGTLSSLAQVATVNADLRVGEDAGTRHLSLRGKILDRDRRGRATRAIGLLLDVTTEKAMQEQMLRMVMSDALTGVPNRRAFDQALRTEVRRGQRAGQPVSVLMIDIANFKNFNDTFGHRVGDEALCTVARALTGCIHRAGDVLARFGGEEFAVVLPDTDPAGALMIAERLVQAVRAVTVRQAPGTAISVSVGVASSDPSNPPTPHATLLARADEALYAAKAAGKNRAVAFEDFLAAGAALEAAIIYGLDAGEFELHYQPVVAASSGHVTGFEALARWNRPGHGMVSPDVFITAAEASTTATLICDIGRWALTEATRQLAAWSAAGISPDRALRVAVNISGRHVDTPAIIADVEAALTTSGIHPTQLEVELTETVLTTDALAEAHLSRIRDLGVTIAIDDFGTGHTSIGQLPHLPVDTLKIDRSLIKPTDPRHWALVKLAIEAAHAFDLHVVAEGIENLETLHALTDLGCDSIQGYHIARPMPAHHIPNWLTTRTLTTC